MHAPTCIFWANLTRFSLQFLATVPLFRGLSSEIIDKLCMEVTPMLAMRHQNVIQQGRCSRGPRDQGSSI
jgi:hypothetical protein